ncbi:MAG: N-acetylmuramoyl-L-alanine amidase [Fibrobacterota bacterium]
MQRINSLLTSSESAPFKNTTIGTHLRNMDIKNLWSSRTAAVDTIVIHYSSAVNRTPHTPFAADEILAIFMEYGVSAHYLILRDGTILYLVPEDQKAWHCGGSIMPAPDNRQGVNNFSIGIELAGMADSPFTDAQYDALSSLIADISRRHAVKTILGHEDIAGPRAVQLGLRKDEKKDPGPLFDWPRIV